MTKAELVAAMAARARIDRGDAHKAVDAFISCVTEAVKAGEAVRIVGFGNFVAFDRPAGTARNPKTGASVARPASKAVKFKPGEGFKAAIQS